MDDETLSVNLSILSKLEISEKLDTKKSLFQIHGNSFIPEFILRFIMGSSRHSDFARIRSLYSQAISHIEDPRMADHIEASLKGLRNLRITYQEDTTLLSRIDCLIQQVTDKLNANQQNSAKKQHYSQTPAPTPDSCAHSPCSCSPPCSADSLGFPNIQIRSSIYCSSVEPHGRSLPTDSDCRACIPAISLKR